MRYVSASSQSVKYLIFMDRHRTPVSWSFLTESQLASLVGAATRFDVDSASIHPSIDITGDLEPYTSVLSAFRTAFEFVLSLSALPANVRTPPRTTDRQATLPSNQLFTTPFPQHRFHVVQAIDGGAHLRLIYYARCLCIGDLAPKIHLHLTLFLGDNSLNDGRGLFWGDVGLP
ncbi:hypothetical protein [Puniceibacterium sp. IMCC21224]|uniref:hypothetical protein n=1 Tax=Puniceibacterium sp. IMCC21224 TaxID=1618204 RepID=UPI0018CE6916|nr:hypothetical protein [Puniceibacterium sp. IMCC21224]